MARKLLPDKNNNDIPDAFENRPPISEMLGFGGRRGFVERLSDAVAELREPLPTKMLGDIRIEKKSAPDYGQPTYNDWARWNFNSWFRNREFPTRDFKKEVGSLDKSSLVMAVVNDTGTALAEAMPSVRVRNAKNKWDPIPDHECALLVQRPNPFNVWADYCGALSLSWWIDGNVYLYKNRLANTGEVYELWYLPHWMVKPRWPGDGKSPVVPTSGANKAQNEYLSHYQFDIPGKQPVLYQQADVLHIKRFVNPDDPRRGLGAFESVITEIYGDGAAARFSATILKNMGIVVPLFMPKDDSYSPTETEAKQFKEKWKQETTGDNAGNAMVMTIPLKPEKYTFSPQEMDLGMLRQIPESRIAAVTRYPAAYLQFLVGLVNGTSYASYQQAREQAYEQVVIPIQQVLATNFTWQLLPEFENSKGAQFYFDTSEVRVLQQDQDALYKRNIDAVRAGTMTVNQFLTVIGQDTIPGGDFLLIPSTSTPTTPERAMAQADGTEQPPAPATPIDPASLAKFAEIEHWFEDLEGQMKEFTMKSSG